MKRINVSFDDGTYEQLVKRAEKNDSKSIANEVRELVDLALKIEAASEKNDGVSHQDYSEQLVEMMKNNLVWMLETRLLTRHLIDQLPGSDHENKLAIMEKCKEKAVSYVEGMLHECKL